MKKTYLSIVILIILVIIILGAWKSNNPSAPITSFDECVAAGNPVMESYPEQCRTVDGQSFTRDVGNEVEKMAMIQITSPRPGAVITSPLTITGKARGNWFFEASFPVILTDWDGRILAQGIATAEGEWMTTEFVAFTSVLNYPKQREVYSKRGTLILQKDNPSGLPEHDDSLEIPVIIN